VLIPKIEETIRYITVKLNENLDPPDENKGCRVSKDVNFSNSGE
jgi:hypothetical protein